MSEDKKHHKKFSIPLLVNIMFLFPIHILLSLVLLFILGLFNFDRFFGYSGILILIFTSYFTIPALITGYITKIEMDKKSITDIIVVTITQVLFVPTNITLSVIICLTEVEFASFILADIVPFLLWNFAYIGTFLSILFSTGYVKDKIQELIINWRGKREKINSNAGDSSE
jgi:hypothetical protein